MYFVKPNEQFPEGAHRWWLRKDQYTIGELYTWEEESRQIAHRLETYDVLVEVVEAYEAWEADLIENADWSSGTPLLTQEQCDRMIEIQKMRNAALKERTE